MNPIEHQSVMVCIEENTERLDLLQKTLEVEERQRKRLEDIKIKMENDFEETQRRSLYEGYTTCTTAASIMDQEDADRRQLMEEMVRHSTPSNAPTVKVLTNVQGNCRDIH